MSLLAPRTSTSRSRADVTITGAAAATTIVDGTDNGRVFTINSGVVFLYDLTVQHGKAPDGSGFGGGSSAAPGEHGAENKTPGMLLITRVIVRENKSGKGANAANLTTCRTGRLLQHTWRGRRSRRRHQQHAAEPPSRRASFINNATGAGGAAGTVACGPGTTCSSSEGNCGNGGALEFDDRTQCTMTA